MDAQTCLQKLELCGVLSFATVDKTGAPQIRCISAIHYDPDRLYFFTARGKAFCDELLSDGRVQILAYTRFKEMIRLSGRAVPAEEQEEKINTIFSEQLYLANVYPGDTRNIGIIFELNSFTIEYFNLGVNPIFRETYTVGGSAADFKGYYITDSCIGCGTCLNHCPQKCIVPGEKYIIQPEHCLHCGACYENCPVKAVEKR
ncbi:4Fe-4S binding protein [Oscillospiraceae bacterium HCP3S3_F4]